jgi:hypothetical protein
MEKGGRKARKRSVSWSSLTAVSSESDGAKKVRIQLILNAYILQDRDTESLSGHTLIMQIARQRRLFMTNENKDNYLFTLISKHGFPKFSCSIHNKPAVSHNKNHSMFLSYPATRLGGAWGGEEV